MALAVLPATQDRGDQGGQAVHDQQAHRQLLQAPPPRHRRRHRAGRLLQRSRLLRRSRLLLRRSRLLLRSGLPLRLRLLLSLQHELIKNPQQRVHIVAAPHLDKF